MAQVEIEELVKARILEERRILRAGTAYRMARLGLLKTYRVGVKGGGVRFRISEVVAALEKLAQAAGTAPKDAAGR
jgi:hypothetical protein